MALASGLTNTQVAAAINGYTSQTGVVALNYVQFDDAMSWLIIFFVAICAPELVSRDLRAGVLPLYFSRPLRSADYVTAKVAALATAVWLLLGVPQFAAEMGQRHVGVAEVALRHVLAGPVDECGKCRPFGGETPLQCLGVEPELGRDHVQCRLEVPGRPGQRPDHAEQRMRWRQPAGKMSAQRDQAIARLVAIDAAERRRLEKDEHELEGRVAGGEVETRYLRDL